MAIERRTISESDNAQDLSLVREVAPEFRIRRARAEEILAAVIRAVRTWRKEAKAASISRAAQDRMAPAFRLAD